MAELPWQATFASVGTTAATTFDEKGVEAGRAYVYRVRSLGADGGPPSRRAWTRPTVLPQPVVSVLAKDKVTVAWDKHPAADVVGYNLYRGVVHVRTVAEGTPGAWQDNDPKYDAPQVVQVRDVTDLKKLNDEPLTGTSFTDAIDLAAKTPAAGDYGLAVYAYVVRAVNRLGTESGPSPYALTTPAEPRNVLCRELGEVAHVQRLRADRRVARQLGREGDPLGHRPGQRHGRQRCRRREDGTRRPVRGGARREPRRPLRVQPGLVNFLNRTASATRRSRRRP